MNSQIEYLPNQIKISLKNFGEDLNLSIVSDLEEEGALFVEDGNHGEYRPLQDEFVEIGVPFVRPPNLVDGRINLNSCQKINETAFKRVRKGIGKGGDIVLTHNATIGRLAITNDFDPVFVTNPQTTIWRAIKRDVIDNRYLYYFMKSKGFQDQLLAHTGRNATFDYVSLTKQRSLSIPIIPLSEQKAIAHILGTLDDKIELNRKMNQTLEAMAQGLFKSWFVDFDPVMDNAFAAGTDIPDELHAMAEKRQLVPDSKKLIRTNPELAAKFPSSFVFNETLGKWIPEGWEVKKIGEFDIYISDFVANGSFASLKENVTLYPEEKEFALFMRNTDLKSGFVKKVYVDKHSYDFLKKSRLLGGEVIISNVGDVGSVYRCPDLDIPMTLGNNVILLNSHFNNFLYQFFIGPLGQALIDGIKGGSAQPKFNKTDFKSQSILIPSKEILDEFERLDSLNRAKLESSIKNTETLIEIRDSLLPELISGRVRVSTKEQTNIL